MDIPPKKFITRLVECALLFALSAYLIRLGISFLSEIWWIMVIIAVVAIASVIAYRVWKRNSGW